MLPFEFSAVIASLNGHNIRSVHAVALVAVIVLLVDDIRRGRGGGNQPTAPRWLLVCLAALAWLLLLSTIFADGFWIQATMSTRRLFTGMAIAALLARSAMSLESRRLILWAYVAGCTVAAVLGFAQVAGLGNSLESVFWGRSNQFGTIERLTLPFGHANVAASHLAVGLIISIGLAATSTTTKHRLWASSCAAVCGYALTLTLSRGPLVAAIIGLAGLTLLASRSQRRTLTLAAVASLIAVAGVSASQASWRLRIENPGPTHWYAVSLDVAPGETPEQKIVTVTNDSQVRWGGSPEEYLEVSSMSAAGLVAVSTFDLPPLEPGQRASVTVNQEEALIASSTVDVWRSGEGRFTKLTMAEAVPLAGPASTIAPQENVGLASRRVLWQAAWTLATERPLNGVGPGNFRLHYQRVIERPAPATSHAHSIVFEPLASWGFPAALLFWAILGTSLLRCGLRATTDLDRALVAALLTVIVVGALDWVVASASGGLTLWLLVGLINQPTASGQDRSTTV